MTDFLTINGWAVPVRDGQGKRVAPERIGESKRAHSGTRRKTERARKTGYQFTTPLMEEDDAETLEHLLEGDGWVISYESSLYDDTKGLGPEAGYSGVSLSAATPKVGSNMLKLNSGSTAVKMEYAAGLDPLVGYTVMAWIRIGASPATWSHYATRYHPDSGDDALVNGVVTGSQYTLQVDADGNVELRGVDPTTNGTASDIYVDDLVILPFFAVTEYVAAVYALSGNGHRALPALTSSGLFALAGTYKVVHGQVEDQQYAQGKVGSAFASNNRALTFSLFEV